MKKVLWRVLFSSSIMLSLAIGDYFLDGWMKFIPMSLLFGFLVPFKNEKGELGEVNE
ncbi:hypothetical protein [Pontibacillus marinus]|uniref:Uncharacterized protein n=1 Tax=Pontibacillus marinus BH030004 = DSM 16465 TaxID=1385511 RepID=A0A0A5HU18_9BACI|nr:hypothetical protein [Pontibacillus marinus]KGX87137.1 hypothetical protein N783_10390 [Pontibacillus marinus BH030004 = DSM 16465]